MQQGTRKLMTMHKALHLIDDVDRLYVSRKEGGRGLISIEETVDATIQRLKDYCHVITHGDEEVRLILSSRVELAVSSSQKSDR